MRFDLEMFKDAIDKAEVVSFDCFDTLLVRLVSSPEAVFRLLESRYGLENFARIRVEVQRDASVMAETKERKPHADLDDIYALMQERYPDMADWDEIKMAEIEAEKDVLKANSEMKAVYDYALSQNKRVIVTSDMYLRAKNVKEFLEENGYDGISAFYVSADEKATKYKGDLYYRVMEKEHVAADKICHIGDNEKDDILMAKAAGWNALHYEPYKMPYEEDLNGESDWDKATARYLTINQENFWYRTGVSIGGPLYAGIYQWFENVLAEEPYDRIVFLARDGFNLYQLMKNRHGEMRHGKPIHYFYMSRRAMMLAGVTELNETELAFLPPFTVGQTVREILEYLCMDYENWTGLEEVGYSSFDDIVVKGEEDKLRRLYVLNKESFLERCAKERRCAEAYVKSLGLDQGKTVLFDCGWNGSSQYFLERFMKTIHDEGERRFAYIGIMDTTKARRQLKDYKYETYLFDCDRNRAVQDKVKLGVVIMEMFFGSPEESVWYYDEKGPVFEKMGTDDSFKNQIFEGISSYVNYIYDLLKKYKVSITEENAISGLTRLVQYPTEEEAVNIGNIANADGFARHKGEKIYIAKMTLEEYTSSRTVEIYWPQGLIKRPDTEEKLKRVLSERFNIRRLDLTEEEEAAAKERSYEDILQEYGRRTADYIEDKKKNPPKTPYELWMEDNEKDQYKITELESNPFFSVVVPVYNVSDEILRECIDSIVSQTYQNFELILVDDKSSWENVGKTLRSYEGTKNVRLIFREENGHISKATNTGIEAAKGDFIVFSDCDDILAPNALYEFAKLLNENPELDFIYSDEDKLTEDGKTRHDPFFKPDWSPDTFMGLMYTNHLAAYRRSLVLKTGLLRSEYDGTQDYDFTLRFMEHSDNKRVGHIQKVLYYWRERAGSIAVSAEAKPYALDAMRRMKEDMLKRRGIKGHPVFVSDVYQYRIVYEPNDNDLVSIIIPSKDNTEMLKACLDSIEKFTEAGKYEIVVVDNGSSEENKKIVEEAVSRLGGKYIYKPMDFNFSAMCNIGAAASTGNILLFLNDDIELTAPNWLPIMAGQAIQEHTGCVGAKLFYTDTNLIQHDGIINLPIGPSHAMLGMSDFATYYFCRNRMDYNWIAVTGAALMLTRDRFEAVGGFDEELSVAYNDVDLCFKLHEMGWYNTVRNDVVMYHHESASRGIDDISEEKKQRLLKERRFLYAKHPNLKGKDPFYNPNLAPNRVDFFINAENKVQLSPVQIGIPEKAEEKSFNYSIDDLIGGREVVVRGWFYTGDGILDNESDIKIVIKGEKRQFTALAEKQLRDDIRDLVDEKAWLVGFNCTIDSSYLIKGEKYQLYLMVERPDGSKMICPTQHMVEIGNHDVGEALSEELPACRDKVVGNIETIRVTENSLDVSGWAFLKKVKSHVYSRSRFFYYTKEGEWQAALLAEQNRQDVAKAYRFKKNLEFCGFTISIKTDQPILRAGILIDNAEYGRCGWMELPLK